MYAQFCNIGIDSNLVSFKMDQQNLFNKGNIPEVSSLCEKHKIIKSFGIVVFYIFATWCEPCKAVEPIYHNLVREYRSFNGEKCAFYKENAEGNSGQEVKSEDAIHIPDVEVVPTFQVFRDGKFFTSTSQIGELTDILESIKNNVV